jgi:two-component system, OmpR family, response regulator MtrA
MSHRILVIDDDFNLAEMVQHALESEGYIADVAHDGRSGLDLYRSNNPNLILLDIAMPGMNGFEVASEIRRVEKGQKHHTPIIILTAYAQSFFVSVGFETQIDGYLTKPIMPKDLIAQIEQFLPDQV